MLYSIPLKQVLETLNNPNTYEELTTERYIAEKIFGMHGAYVYYYLSLPATVRQIRCSKC